MPDIFVNKLQWESLSAAKQIEIVEGLKSVNAIQTSDFVVGDADTPEFNESTKMEPLWNPLKDICKAACDASAASGAAWCAANTAGIAYAACLAAAEAARRKCRDGC